MAQYLGYDGHGFVRAEQVAGQAVTEGMRPMFPFLVTNVSLSHIITYGPVHPSGRQWAIRGVDPDKDLRDINIRPAELQVVYDGIAHFFR